MSIPFLKMHGLGNDFVIIDARGGTDPVTPALARAIGNRHCGVGFDQLAVIGPSANANAKLVFWNADGSTAGACGNATRCVARLIFEENPDSTVTIETERGLLVAHCEADGRISGQHGCAAARLAANPARTRMPDDRPAPSRRAGRLFNGQPSLHLLHR